MVKHTGQTAENGAKAAMGKMSLPETDLAAENAALRAKVSQLEAENSALRAKLEATHQPPQAAAPVPATIEPLPKELEQTLGRDAIWALVRPEAGKDSRSVLERHRVIWARFDKVLRARGPEGSRGLRNPLKTYLEALEGLKFSPEDKKRIVARLNFMMRSVAVRLRFGAGVGPLGVSGPSLRIQASSRLADGRQKRTYTSLGVTFPPELEMAEEPQRSPGVARKMIRKAPKSHRPSRGNSAAYKYL